MSGPPPLVSVITVCRNAEESLRVTVSSVLTQTRYRYIDYRVQDGASDDGTMSFLKGVDASIQVSSSPDAGVFDAMNRALAQAKGSFVLFLNAGDTFYSPAVIEQLESHLNAALADDDCPGVVGINEFFSGRSPHLVRRSFTADHVPHQALFLKLSYYRALGGFNISYRYTADSELWGRADLRKLRRINCIVSRSSFGGISTSRRYLIKRMLEHCKYEPALPVFRRFVPKIIASYFLGQSLCERLYFRANRAR